MGPRREGNGRRPPPLAHLPPRPRRAFPGAAASACPAGASHRGSPRHRAHATASSPPRSAWPRSPRSPFLPSFLPPPPPLGVPGSGPSSPRPSCERVTRESRATNRRSVNKRRAPGGPARPHPAQPADEAPPAGRHPALRHRRERRGSAGSRARDGGAGRAAPAPLRLPPPGRAAGAAGLWRPLAALCGEDGRAARGAAPRCGAAGGAWVGLGRPGSVPPNRPLLALVEIGVPVCSCCVLVAEIIAWLRSERPQGHQVHLLAQHC